MTSNTGGGIRLNTHDENSLVTDNIDAGSISALEISVSVYYNHNNTLDNDKTFGKNQLTLIDIQYLGTRTSEKFMLDVKEPRKNSLFINRSSNIGKVICNDLTKNKKTSRALQSKRDNLTSKRSTSSRKNSDCVTEYISSLLPDELEHHYTDYDSFLEGFVSKSMYAGSMSKMRRLPVINIYRNVEEIKFKQAMVGTQHTVGDDNKSNFIVYSSAFASNETAPSKDSTHIYLVAETSKIEYVSSYTIDPINMVLQKVKDAKSLDKYKGLSDGYKDIMISGCDLVKLIDSSESS